MQGEANQPTAAEAECPGCGRPAPPPEALEAREWHVVEDPRKWVRLCPDCLGSAETIERVIGEEKRHWLSHAEVPMDVKRRAAQREAWLDWHRRALAALKRELGGDN